MLPYSILYIEDDANEIQLMNDANRELEQVLQPNGNKIFTFEVSESLGDAHKKLKDEKYDTVIIDLKLKNNNTIIEGNSIIKEIIKAFRIPIFVYTNNLANLDDELTNENDVYKIVEKSGKSCNDLLREIKELLDTGISDLFKKDGFFENDLKVSLQDLFWVYMAKSWKMISEGIKDKERKRKYIERYLGSLINEKNKVTDEGTDEAHFSEVYYSPPFKKILYSGDILIKNEVYYIILNASCDMEKHADDINAGNFVVAKLIKYSEHEMFNKYKENRIASNKNELIEIFKNKKNRYHFLPPFGDIHGFIIDFELLTYFPKNHFNINDRITSISESFFKNVVYRFSNFYSRQGQPDFIETDIRTCIDI
jgi:hypothetical protein